MINPAGVRRRKIGLVMSAQYTVEVFLLDQLRHSCARYDVTLFVKTDDAAFLARKGIGVRVVNAPMERKISIMRDLRALLFLIREFRANSFDLVHSATPKAGLLGMVAARIAGVPVRIHTFTGQVWGSRTGLMRWILKSADKVTAYAATHILADSLSQRDFLVRERVVLAEKSRVLAAGSISGVNLERFRADAALRFRVRRELGIPTEAVVFLFMARLTRDKGALVMAEGFARFCESDQTAHLVVVGPDEEGLRPQMRRLFGASLSRVHFEEYTRVPENFIAATDVICLPSYREGFGTVLINAASAGVPGIASRIYGSEDAISDNVTGLLHEAGSAAELAGKMRLLSTNPKLRRELGDNARVRVRREFSEAVVTQAVIRFYDECMSKTQP